MGTEVFVYEPDLLFSSRIESVSAKAGFQARVLSDFEGFLQELKRAAPRIVFLNLDAAEGKLAALEGIAKNGSCKIVGYYSHVNTRLAEEARRIGLVTVFSRGAFVIRLDEILRELSSG